MLTLSSELGRSANMILHSWFWEVVDDSDSCGRSQQAPNFFYARKRMQEQSLINLCACAGGCQGCTDSVHQNRVINIPPARIMYTFTNFGVDMKNCYLLSSAIPKHALHFSGQFLSKLGVEGIWGIKFKSDFTNSKAKSLSEKVNGVQFWKMTPRASAVQTIGGWTFLWLWLCPSCLKLHSVPEGWLNW
jgi:hypothetical protein